MAIISFPPAPDLNYYRQAYPELNNFVDDVLAEHCKRFAAEQGHSTCLYDRREALHKFLQATIDSQKLTALEIGCGAFPFLVGEHVKYFETLSAEVLKQNYRKRGRNVDKVPAKFDFVSSTGDLGVIDETFDIVFSCHVIEHTPDLIEHLRGVSRILNAGGLYVLIVPDKRYCFDHYNAETTLGEVIDAFANERKIPRLADVIGHVCTRTHNSAVLHWLGHHGERYGYRNAPLEPDARVEIMGEYFFDDGKGATFQKLSHLVERYSEALEQSAYINAHNWKFTPDSFGYIVDVLNKLQLIDLTLYRLCHTLWGRQEFIAVLEKS